MTCPECGKINTDDWPIIYGDDISWGGCQECWEIQCDASWWEAVIAIDKAMHPLDRTEVV